MAIEISKDFEVDRPIDEVWDFLVDPARVVGCLPGAKMTGRVDDRTYEGEMGVQLGPMGVTFRGTVHFDRLDPEGYEVEMSGTGKDRNGSGNASMRMHSKLTHRDGGGTRVDVTQTVSLSGRLASFGRGGVIQSVADFLFGRFTKCVARRLEAGE